MDKQRFLVLHDYGMGGLWWWITARSVREIRETFAEVEVVDAPDMVANAETWGLAEVDIDAAAVPDELSGLRDQRAAQRGRPGFGALADRETVWLRRRWDEDVDEPVDYLMEIGPDGRRLRQVELGGESVRSGPEDWPLNPPIVDLYDPELITQEIGQAEFEVAWAGARDE
ncbi:hypothetical protein [Actinokineospora sp. HUAS TT18]|uniref:hypothetical protein n=1 Tax=Actinokineospora sp. HUAS TT18 TaxID=3447451 RepID=UPI003F51B649